MARVPVQKQTTGIHSALSEPEMFSGQPSFPIPMRRNHCSHTVFRSCGVLQLRLGQADPDVSKDHSALIFKVEHYKKTTSAGYAGNYSTNDMM